MIQKTTITVKEVLEIQHGVTSDNRPWTLYSVVAIDGKRYGTFNEKYKDSAGKAIEIEYEEKESKKINPKTGKPYVNLNIVEPKKAQANGWTPQLIEKLFVKLQSIESKLEMLTAGGEEETPEVVSPEEIDPANIPF